MSRHLIAVRLLSADAGGVQCSGVGRLLACRIVGCPVFTMMRLCSDGERRLVRARTLLVSLLNSDSRSVRRTVINHQREHSNRERDVMQSDHEVD